MLYANAICYMRMRYAICEYAMGRANAICDTRIGYTRYEQLQSGFLGHHIQLKSLALLHAWLFQLMDDLCMVIPACAYSFFGSYSPSMFYVFLHAYVILVTMYGMGWNMHVSGTPFWVGWAILDSYRLLCMSVSLVKWTTIFAQSYSTLD